VSAVVESDRLPFIGRSFPNVPYLLATAGGTGRGTARVSGSSLSGRAGGGVPADTGAAPLAPPPPPQGSVTPGRITPANGTQGVSPTVQVELAASAPLKAEAGNFAKVALLQGSDRVDVRYLLSGSGRRLAVIPTKPLEVSTEYTVSVGDLRDAYDGAVQVSPSTFRTRDLVAPVFDLDAIEFSISDDGVITIKAAIGTLPKGGQVL